MKKITKPIDFELPISREVVDLSRRNGISTRLIGNLHITGTAKLHPNEQEPDDRYTFELHGVNWQGMDLLPLFEAHYFEDVMDHVSGATFKHCMYLFESTPEEEIRPDPLFDLCSGIVSSAAKMYRTL